MNALKVSHIPFNASNGASRKTVCRAQLASFALFVLFVLGTLSLAGCADKKNTAVEAAPMASIQQQDRQIAERLESQKAAQELRSNAESEAAERERLVVALNEPYARWSALFQQVAGKKANETAELVSKMRAVIAELADAPSNECTLPVKTAVVSAIRDAYAAIADFKSAKDDATVSALSKRLGEAVASADGAVANLTKCR